MEIVSLIDSGLSMCFFSSTEDEPHSEVLEDGDSDFDFAQYEPIRSIGNRHQVCAIALQKSLVSFHDLQCMQHGTTVLRWDSSTAHSTLVNLRLENDFRLLSWMRVPCSAQKGTTSSFGSHSVFRSDGESKISGALIGHYQMALPYKIDEPDEGFLDLMTVKDFSTGSGSAVDIGGSGKSLSSSMISKGKNYFVLLFGTNMTDNRTIEFLMPPKVAKIWLRGLSGLSKAVDFQRRKLVDRRLLWLKEQYLQLYFENSKCSGPTPDKAFKVRTSRYVHMYCNVM